MYAHLPPSWSLAFCELVIPGRPAGPDPESRSERIPSFWIPGSRAIGLRFARTRWHAPRNDKHGF